MIYEVMLYLSVSGKRLGGSKVSQELQPRLNACPVHCCALHPALTFRYLALVRQQHQSSLPAACRLVSSTKRAGNAVT